MSKDDLEVEVDVRGSWTDNLGLGGGGFCSLALLSLIEVDIEPSSKPAFDRVESDVTGFAPNFRVGGGGGGAVNRGVPISLDPLELIS